MYNNTLDFELSKIERDLFRRFSDKLDSKGFKYLSVPSAIKWETLDKQGFDRRDSLHISDRRNALAGSAEQGILEYFQDKKVDSMKIYAQNTCFRRENIEIENLRLEEFIKLEQFCFTTKDKWEEDFNLLLNNAIEFLDELEIKNRVVDMTIKDKGYHLKKLDIEIYTEKYGWIESHSCTYFGEEQTKRFNITGSTHTISNTGIASPRILIPIIEKLY
ncbi:seryl-tRNA synthetase [Bacillus phage vB_BpuM-BpSp]|nr:seryl-tRNA synthetase [Bacillus phage vB_BpuM-BpSp]